MTIKKNLTSAKKEASDQIKPKSIQKKSAEKVSEMISQTAPNFRLKTQSGKEFDLYQTLDSGKKVLLVFYPKDDTPGCTIQACGLRDTYAQYQDLGVVVVGVNQGDDKSHNKFIAKHDLPYDILVDQEGDKLRVVAGLYSAIGSFMGHTTTKRGVFLIDTDKTIIYHTWGQQDNQAIINFLQSNQS